MDQALTVATSTLPLFYRSVVPLDRHSHRNWRLAQPQRFAFAGASHLIPAVLDEFGPACRHLPIVFLPESLGPVPVFLVGAVPGRCSLVDAEGAWTGRYLPAYLRRYPFILGEGAGPEPLVCLDAEADLVLRELETASAADPETPTGEGTESLPLFAADGSETDLLRERIRLVVDYAEAARRTAAFGRLIQDLGLLRPLTVRMQDPVTGEAHTLHGVLGVDEAVLSTLPEDSFIQLHREGWLPAIYAHLISLQAVADVLVPVVSAPQPTDPEPTDLSPSASTGNAA